MEREYDFLKIVNNLHNNIWKSEKVRQLINGNRISHLEFFTIKHIKNNQLFPNQPIIKLCRHCLSRDKDHILCNVCDIKYNDQKIKGIKMKLNYIIN